MNIGFDLIAGNVGMVIPNIILLITTVGGIIFYAKSFQLGLVLQFFSSGLLFMWFFRLDWIYVPALSVMLISFVLLAFSLYAGTKATIQGAVI